MKLCNLQILKGIELRFCAQVCSFGQVTHYINKEFLSDGQKGRNVLQWKKLGFHCECFPCLPATPYIQHIVYQNTEYLYRPDFFPNLKVIQPQQNWISPLKQWQQDDNVSSFSLVIFFQWQCCQHCWDNKISGFIKPVLNLIVTGKLLNEYQDHANITVNGIFC